MRNIEKQVYSLAVRTGRPAGKHMSESWITPFSTSSRTPLTFGGLTGFTVQNYIVSLFNSFGSDRRHLNQLCWLRSSLSAGFKRSTDAAAGLKALQKKAWF